MSQLNIWASSLRLNLMYVVARHALCAGIQQHNWCSTFFWPPFECTAITPKGIQKLSLAKREMFSYNIIKRESFASFSDKSLNEMWVFWGFFMWQMKGPEEVNV